MSRLTVCFIQFFSRHLKPLQTMVTRNPAVDRIADHTGCHWPSRSSKVDDFQLPWKGECDVLLLTSSNLDPIWHGFWNMAIGHL